MKMSRSNDRPPGAEGTTSVLDGTDIIGSGLLSDVVGSWFNSSRSTGEISHLNVAIHREGLALQIFGAGTPDPIPWPETTAIPFVAALGSREVTGFEGHCDLGFMETHLAMNLKYGTLVVQTYNRFKDGSGRGCYFTREFFYQDAVDDRGPSEPGRDAAGMPFTMTADLPHCHPDGDVDLRELTGLWKNTRRATRAIRELRLRQEGGCYLLHAAGAGAPRDWGEVPVMPCASAADARDPAGFYAVYDFGFKRMFLAANMNKGLMIIVAYNMFLDGSPRSNYFAREFFYQVGPSDRKSSSD
jgi:hypothetical protein